MKSTHHTLLMIGSSFMNKWKLQSKKYHVINRGISGLFSHRLFSAEQFRLLDNEFQKAHLIFFYSGANDVDRQHVDPVLIAENNERYLEFLLHESPRSAKIIVFSLLKSPRILADSSKRESVDYINRKMRVFCKKHPRLVYFDFNRLMTRPEYYSNNNHLNDLGYEAIENKMKSKLDFSF